MQELVREIGALVAWYRQHARNVIEELTADRVENFDSQVKRLERLAQIASSEVGACFLGQSGVGKSTLINALVGEADVILPTGGVGPLTAQALEVRYSERPIFTVDYHRLQQFWQLVFALEQRLLRTNQKGDESELSAELDPEDDRLRLDDARATDHLERQARLLVTGDQNTTVDVE